jgi:hypothetical protein
MGLREEILKEHSRRQALKIAGWVGKDKKRFSRLLDLFLNDEYRVVQRSGYPLSIIIDKYPALAEANIHKIVNRLDDEGTHPAVRRNIIRMLQTIEIPEDLEAKVMDYCIKFLSDPKEVIAVKCFSITVLGRLAVKYPEIKNEAEAVINQAMKKPSAGMKVRAREFYKLIS